MMISTFKPKAQLTHGIDVTHPASQASEIASMISATSFTADVAAGTATFEYAGGQVTVKTGEVISVSTGAVSVQSRDDFYEAFEEASATN